MHRKQAPNQTKKILDWSGGGEGQATGTLLQREDLAGAGKEEDVDADESNTSLLSLDVVNDDGTVRALTCGEGTEHGNQELADSHSDGTPEKHGATTPAVDGDKTRDGGDDVDDGGDHLDDEGLADTRVLKRDHGGDETDTETSKEATSEEQGQGDSGSLEDDTQVEDPAGGDEGPATTDGVGEED
ncbi:hypothetical protein PoMZ_03919 [Pyricularia oryzae]|uniref:Uncharacterized protein n=1 Tax=Pyricularia oryzae TaxID=318829 RepID=A0A4P7NDC3_PYROR|nr:hypothetical protein PoMZ_03919 [Pyricularia oryzae]